MLAGSLGERYWTEQIGYGRPEILDMPIAAAALPGPGHPLPEPGQHFPLQRTTLRAIYWSMRREMEVLDAGGPDNRFPAV